MKDMFRKVSTLTMTQVSRVHKYTQVSMKEGTKMHGYKVLDMVFTEFAQLDNKSIFDPQDAKELTSTAKYKNSNLPTMAKEKWDGKFKGRACADGQKQRLYIPKKDVASPTVQF